MDKLHLIHDFLINRSLFRSAMSRRSPFKLDAKTIRYCLKYSSPSDNVLINLSVLRTNKRITTTLPTTKHIIVVSKLNSIDYFTHKYDFKRSISL